jgi:hypothetical protein
MPELKEDWSIPVSNEEGGESIIVPDYLSPLFNKLGMQMQFHKYSGKNEVLTVAHMVQMAEEFFTGVKYDRK